MRTAGLRAMTACALAATTGAAAAAVVPAQARPAYAEGQVWEYHARPQDAGSLLRIQRIEAPDAFRTTGPIYHISIVGLHFAGARLTGELQHAPVSRATLDASATRLSGSRVPFPDASAGIAEWRAARGGVFTIPVAQIVALVEQTAHGDGVADRPPPHAGGGGGTR